MSDVSQPTAQPANPDWFRVEVSDAKGQVVAIDSASLCGREVGASERRAIERAVAHLQGFWG